MNRRHRAGRRVLDAAARLPVYALLVASLILIIATANDAPRVTTAATTPTAYATPQGAS